MAALLAGEVTPIAQPLVQPAEGAHMHAAPSDTHALLPKYVGVVIDFANCNACCSFCCSHSPIPSATVQSCRCPWIVPMHLCPATVCTTAASKQGSKPTSLATPHPLTLCAPMHAPLQPPNRLLGAHKPDLCHKLQDPHHPILPHPVLPPTMQAPHRLRGAHFPPTDREGDVQGGVPRPMEQHERRDCQHAQGGRSD